MIVESVGIEFRVIFVALLALGMTYRGNEQNTTTRKRGYIASSSFHENSAVSPRWFKMEEKCAELKISPNWQKMSWKDSMDIDCTTQYPSLWSLWKGSDELKVKSISECFYEMCIKLSDVEEMFNHQFSIWKWNWAVRQPTYSNLKWKAMNDSISSFIAGFHG